MSSELDRLYTQVEYTGTFGEDENPASITSEIAAAMTWPLPEPDPNSPLNTREKRIARGEIDPEPSSNTIVREERRSRFFIKSTQKIDLKNLQI